MLKVILQDLSICIIRKAERQSGIRLRNLPKQVTRLNWNSTMKMKMEQRHWYLRSSLLETILRIRLLSTIT